jgi:hypothetical protein
MPRLSPDTGAQVIASWHSSGATPGSGMLDAHDLGFSHVPPSAADEEARLVRLAPHPRANGGRGV